MSSNKPRILLLADVPGWIFERHCFEIKSRLGHKYDFTVDYACECNPEKYLDNTYDIIYALEVELIRPNILPHGLKNVISGIRVEGLYRSTPRGIRKYYNSKIKDKVLAFHTVNRRQYREFEQISELPLLYCPHGVDISVFCPDNYEKPNNTTPVIGSNGALHRPHKGLGLISKACNKADVELKTALQNLETGHLTKEQMPAFYNEIDVYCNMSAREGLNNSIMEAGAMGLPVIATRVGAAEEMIEHGESGFLIDRKVGELTECLNILAGDKNLRARMGQAFREEILSNWSWDKCIGNYEYMFDLALNKRE